MLTKKKKNNVKSPCVECLICYSYSIFRVIYKQGPQVNQQNIDLIFIVMATRIARAVGEAAKKIVRVSMFYHHFNSICKPATDLLYSIHFILKKRRGG